MRIDQKIQGRFQELLEQGVRVMETRTRITGGFPVAYLRGMVRNQPVPNWQPNGECVA